MRPSDIVHQDELVTAFMNSFFLEGNEGHVIVVPNKHFENIYDIMPKYAHRIFDVAQNIALAMKEAYGCDGITTRQNNEPAGDQHAFHFHFHIFPRYNADRFNTGQPAKKHMANPEVRNVYAIRLLGALHGKTL